MDPIASGAAPRAIIAATGLLGQVVKRARVRGPIAGLAQDQRRR